MNRAAVVLAAVTVTAGFAGLAFLLGDVGFETRRFSLHEGRLRRLAALQPRADQVTQALLDEGARLLGIARGPAELDALARRYGGARSPEVAARAARWPETRAFLAADMVYFISFDAGGVMRDFTCVTRPGRT